ncbi:hypothetical protein WAI453_009450 [Rhynchosporium graminicola]
MLAWRDKLAQRRRTQSRNFPRVEGARVFAISVSRISGVMKIAAQELLDEESIETDEEFDERVERERAFANSNFQYLEAYNGR